MGLAYNFNTGKWEEQGGTQATVKVAAPVVQPKINLAPRQPVAPLPVVKLAPRGNPTTPAPALKVEALQNLQQAPLRVAPTSGMQTGNSPQLQNKAVTQAIQPAGKVVTNFNPQAPTNNTGRTLDLTRLQELQVSGVDGSAPPRPKTDAQKYADEIRRITDLSTTELVIGKEKKDFGWDQKVVGFFLDSLTDTYGKAVRDKVIGGDIAEEVATGRMDQSVFDSLEGLNQSTLQDIGNSFEFAVNAVSLVYGGTALTKATLKTAGGQITKEVAKVLAKEGAKEGAVIGFTNGVAQAVSSGSSDPAEIARIIALNTGGGAILGSAANTLIPVASNMIAKGVKAGVKSFTETQEQTVQQLMRRGMSRTEAKKMATQGGYWQMFKNARIDDLELRWDEIQAAKVNATNKKTISGFEKAQKAIEKEIRLEYRRVTQGGFIKNPFAKEVPPVDPDLPQLVPPKEDNIAKKLYTALKPIKAADPEVQGIYSKWSNARMAAKEAAQVESTNLSKIPGKTGALTGGKGKQGLQTVLDYEKGVPTKYSDDIARSFDNLHDEAIAKGFEVPYRQNYVPQMYKNSPEEITMAVAKYMKDNGVEPAVIADYIAGKEIPSDITGRLKLNPSFEKQRVFPNYETATKYGLTPRYTHPSQLAAAYRENLETAVANRQLVDDLMATGQLTKKQVPGSSLVDWPILNGPMYAKNDLASALNAVLANQGGASTAAKFGRALVAKGASVSKFMQELALSAGFPGTDINFFAMGQLIKQGTTRVGQVITQPVKATVGLSKDLAAFVRANFDGKTIQFFQKKAPIIQKMAENGIDISDRVGNFRDIYKNAVASPEWTKAFGRGWDRVFQKKTFASFMPQLYINTFEEVYKQGLRKGLDDAAASALAANATKAFHGMTGDVARGKVTQDALSTALFAPKFREGIINTLWNTGKGATTKLFNKDYAKNRQLLIGMALTFAGYQAVNMKLNGHPTWENEKGREFALKIPLPDGENVMYVEFMPSFLSLPRNLISGGIALTKLDMKTASQKFSSLASMPVQITSQIINNEDYFGRPIYGEKDSKKERLTKIAEYLLLKQSHPYMRLVSDYINQDPTDRFQKPLYQSMVEAAEFPVKFNTLDRISRQDIYERDDKKQKEFAKVQDRVRPLFDQVQELKAQGKSKSEVESIVGSFDDLSDEEQRAYETLRTANIRKNTTDTKSYMYAMFEQVEKLKAQGMSKEQVEEIVGSFDSLTDEEKKAYNLLKNQFVTYGEDGNIVKSYKESLPKLEKMKTLDVGFEKTVNDPRPQGSSPVNTEAIAQKFSSGSIGGQCTTFLHKIINFPSIGDGKLEKFHSVDNKGISADEWRNDIRVGDVVVTGENQTYGHTFMVEEVLPGGKVRVLESNRRGDEKVTRDRVVDINNPAIYGAIRGTPKSQYQGTVAVAPQKEFNSEEFMNNLRNL